jgi:hypothetical protein
MFCVGRYKHKQNSVSKNLGGGYYSDLKFENDMKPLLYGELFLVVLVLL